MACKDCVWWYKNRSDPTVGWCEYHDIKSQPSNSECKYLLPYPEPPKEE